MLNSRKGRNFLTRCFLKSGGWGKFTVHLFTRWNAVNTTFRVSIFEENMPRRVLIVCLFWSCLDTDVFSFVFFRQEDITYVSDCDSSTASDQDLNLYFSMTNDCLEQRLIHRNLPGPFKKNRLLPNSTSSCTTFQILIFHFVGPGLKTLQNTMES